MKPTKLLMSGTLCLSMLCLAASTSAAANPSKLEMAYRQACRFDYENVNEHDIQTAIAAYENAANLGSITAKGILSVIYSSGEGGVTIHTEKALELARVAAEMNCPFGHYTLANACRKGDGVERDLNKAATHDRAAMPQLRKLADAGNARAQQMLGVFYATGRGGLAKDDAQAVIWYRKSADQQLARGQHNLARMYEEGRGGIEKDLAKATALYAKAAGQGYAPAKYALGVASSPTENTSLEEFQTKARDVLAWFQAAAKQGYVNALLAMVEVYRDGTLGVAVDETKAVHYLAKAADLGDAQSQAVYGGLFANGRYGVTRDFERAVSLFKASAAQGNAIGQANLAKAYMEGVGGLKKSDKEAARLFKLASQQNEPDSFYHLGVLYQHGRGLDKNEKEGVRLFKKAAEHGDALAMVELGTLHEFGRCGLERNMTTAANYYAKAAAKNEPNAQFFLACHLLTGDGVEFDIPRAIVLLEAASKQGLPLATDLLTNLNRFSLVNELSSPSLGSGPFDESGSDGLDDDWKTYYEVQNRYDRSRDSGLNYNRR